MGKFLIFFGLLFTTIETIYFGGNLTPQSYPELICDFIGTTITLIGILLYVSNKAKSLL